MKLQGLGIICALIVLPIILVLSYYISLQVDTVDMQNEYDGYLLDATHNALASFEINTANEDLSSVSDSLRTIIEASSNIFMNTLSTNLGMSNASKSYVEPYIPALLYTLYDGYYIYAPTKVPTVLTDTDGNAVSVGDVGVKISGGDFAYTNVHITQEQQDNCPDCSNGSESGHIKYVAGNDYSSEYLSYSDLSDEKKKDYGQLLYLKKKTTPTEPDSYTTNINDAEFEVDNVLKTYMPYSARYQCITAASEKKDITVIYTLDNYVTIQGSIGKVYYTKSGYLLPKDATGNVSGVSIISTESDDPDVPATPVTSDDPLLNYSQESAKDYIEAGNRVKVIINDATDAANKSEIIANAENSEIINIFAREGFSLTKPTKLQLTELKNTLNNRLSTAQTLYVQLTNNLVSEDSVNEFLNSINYYGFTTGTSLDKLLKAVSDITKEINEIQSELDKISAVTYYVQSTIFSNWVYTNLSDIQEKHLIEISGQSYKSVDGKEQVTYSFAESDNFVFDVKGSTEKGIIEISEDSPFYTHKLNVIKNSIQFNLNSAMSTYNSISARTVSYSMPVMSDSEWEKILNNVSLVAFMQGYKCGLKTYNNYKIVSSTNNELSFLLENIYFVEKDKFCDELTEYHKIDCPKINSSATEFIAFRSNDAKYDKLYDKNNDSYPYSYDHRNLACYDCITDGNYKGTKIFNGTADTLKLRTAYYLGIGKLRNNLYKMNAVAKSQGYEVIEPGGMSTLPLKDVKSIEIVIGTLKTKSPDETVVNYNIKYGTTHLNETIYSVVTNVTSDHTITVNVNPTVSSTNKFSYYGLDVINQNPESTVYSPSDSDPTVCKFEGETSFDTRQTLIFRDVVKYIRLIYK